MSQGPALTAVVLGGGEDALARHRGAASKALVPLGGKPMAAYVLETLAASPAIERVVYVGEQGGLEPYLAGAAVVPAGATLTHSLALGLGAALGAGAPGLLVLGADLPWLTAAGLERFVSGAPGADLVYPVVPRAVSEAQFPGQRRTYARVREGQFTGGNLVLLTPGVVPGLLTFTERLYRGRKNPLAIATIFGADVLVKFFTGRVTIPELEARASGLLGARVRAFISDDASLGADIDELEHLRDFQPPV